MRAAPQRASFLALSLETREQKMSIVPEYKVEQPGNRRVLDITVDITKKGFMLAGKAKQRKPTDKKSIHT